MAYLNFLCIFCITPLLSWICDLSICGGYTVYVLLSCLLFYRFVSHIQTKRKHAKIYKKRSKKTHPKITKKMNKNKNTAPHHEVLWPRVPIKTNRNAVYAGRPIRETWLAGDRAKGFKQESIACQSSHIACRETTWFCCTFYSGIKNTGTNLTCDSSEFKVCDIYHYMSASDRRLMFFA